jgi:hypothetical protein
MPTYEDRISRMKILVFLMNKKVEYLRVTVAIAHVLTQ